MPRKDAPSLFELVQTNQPATERSKTDPPAAPEPELPADVPTTADSAPSGWWVRSDGERVRFSLSVIGLAVTILSIAMVLTIAFTVGRFVGGRDRGADPNALNIDPIKTVMERAPTPEVLGNLSQQPVPAQQQLTEAPAAQADLEGEWVLGLNYVWVETFKTEDDALQAQAFLKRAGVETTSFPFEGGYRLLANQGFDYSNPDDKAACEGLTQRIKQLGDQYSREGGRYRFKYLVKKMTAPW